MKNIKNILIYLLLLNAYGVMAQTPLTDSHWIMNNTFSDEFNGSRKNIWSNLTGSGWGIETFRSQNIQYGSENGRTFLRLVAEMVNGIAYTGGIETGFEKGYLGLGYGYYEIEARVLRTSGISSGLWPAFWTIHSYKPTNSPPYWYEEIDIFEPTNCQINNKEHVVGYHRRLNDNVPTTPVTKDEGIKYNVDMSLWHKYAVEWLPGRLTFYLNDEPFFVIGGGKPTPYHQNTNLLIDLQVGGAGRCPPNITNGILGYFDINYFRYYKLNCSNTVITEDQGNGYNFNNYTYTVKKSCIFKNTSIPSGKSIIIRATDFVELKENFQVPLGAELYIDVNPCE
ncbi:MAG: family 16 glycosylhydrolase [Bacteroidales bacterium]|nr:family 16 glycosylhydrolase [Bacteroidales bacterium]